MKKVRINQVGYKPSAVKYAVFADLDVDDRSFAVVDEAGNSVFEGDIPAGAKSAMSGEVNAIGDFSALTKAGRYKLVTSKGEESYEFTMAEDVFDSCLESLVKMLYLQRCGVELTEEEAGEYAHPVCHSGLTVINGTDIEIDVTGGWHDAGDYGRYIVSGAKTVVDLFMAHELGVAKALDEAKFEVDWFFKMQDEVTGGVYHKVTCESFPGFVMPEDETEKLVVCPISNTATGDFAAIMAMAANIYKDIDSAYANRCLQAAKRAYDYLVVHQDDPGFKNPANVVTGEYPDDNCFDEFMWASVELYKVTCDEKYFATIQSSYKKVDKLTLLGWEDMGGYAVYSALTCENLAKNHPDFVEELSAAFFKQIDQIVANCKANTYRINRFDNFEWGSNMGVANDGMILMMASNIRPNDEYKFYAKAMLDYLFGVNATDYCFITGEGTNNPMHPHHRPSGATGKPMPGMLVGGPDNGLHDERAVEALTGKAPAKCYIDHIESYSTNEICVYWNSPLITLMAML